VTSGSGFCHLAGVDDNCVTDGYRNYGSNEACTIEVMSDGLLSATGTFSTEFWDDYLLINGQRYSGRAGPSNIVVAAGSSFIWRSDHSSYYQNGYSGWTVCLAAGTDRALIHSTLFLASARLNASSQQFVPACAYPPGPLLKRVRWHAPSQVMVCHSVFIVVDRCHRRTKHAGANMATDVATQHPAGAQH